METGAVTRILVVDDEPEVREMVGEMLIRAGHRVVLAADGLEAMKKLEKEEFASIVTDILMPEQEGLETVLAVRKKHPRTKIIAISGGGRYGASDYLETASFFGADRVFGKPVSWRELTAAVEELLAERSESA